MRPSAGTELRVLHDVAHLRECEELQREVWGVEDREVVPVSQLRAAEHAGGLVAGAFDDHTLIGFVYGFPARAAGSGTANGMHSHMLGVASAHRGRGIGLTLKWFQRRWCLDRGIEWIAWTFDPLQARNANLNLERLGAVGVEYHEDFYGSLGGELAGDVATDRLVALWRLDAPHVAARERGGAIPPPPNPVAALGTRGGEPADLRLDLDAPQVSITAPLPTAGLLTDERERSRRWRLAHRKVFAAYLGRGYVAERFMNGAYHLVLR